MTGGFLRPGGWWSRDDKKQHKVIAREQCGPGSWRSASLGLCHPQRLYLRRAPNILPTSARAVCCHRGQGRACAERPVSGGERWRVGSTRGRVLAPQLSGGSMPDFAYLSPTSCPFEVRPRVSREMVAEKALRGAQSSLSSPAARPPGAQVWGEEPAPAQAPRPLPGPEGSPRRRETGRAQSQVRETCEPSAAAPTPAARAALARPPHGRSVPARLFPNSRARRQPGSPPGGASRSRRWTPGSRSARQASCGTRGALSPPSECGPGGGLVLPAAPRARGGPATSVQALCPPLPSAPPRRDSPCGTLKPGRFTLAPESPPPPTRGRTLHSRAASLYLEPLSWLRLQPSPYTSTPQLQGTHL